MRKRFLDARDCRLKVRRAFISLPRSTSPLRGGRSGRSGRKNGTPVYVYSAGTIEDHYHRLDAALGELDHQICYAVKANSNRAVLRLLAQAGAGFDIVSGGELFRVSVPRNVEPRINTLTGVFCKDLNDLNGIIESNVERRRSELPRAELIIAEELAKFSAWCNPAAGDPGDCPVEAAERGDRADRTGKEPASLQEIPISRMSRSW